MSKEHCVIRFGIISDFNAAKGQARVTFTEDNIVSGWLPMLFRRTSGDQEFDAKKAKEKVFCLMDSNCNNGVILGSYYDAQNTPPSLASATASGRKYADGTEIYYDTETSTFAIKIGTIEFVFDKTGIFKITNGTDSLGAILTDLCTALEALTVTCAAPGSPSSPPLNLASFTAISTRLASLLS